LSVQGIQLDSRDGRAILVLADEDTERCFPLWLGDHEAQSIARALGRAAAAPDAIEVLAGMICGLGAKLVHVEVTGAVHRVVTAALVVADASGHIAIPARASDAIALALRLDAPILVPDELLSQVAARVADAEARTQSRPPAAAESVLLSTAERWNTLLAHLSQSGSPKIYEG
jgi:bifunctional DNase/RNase